MVSSPAAGGTCRTKTRGLYDGSRAVMSSFDRAQDDIGAQDDIVVADSGTNHSVIVSTVEL